MSDGNATKKNEKKSGRPRAARGQKRSETVRKAIFATVWIFAVVVVSQTVIGIVMGLILREKLLETVWSGVYSVLTYALALSLTLVVLPKIFRQWATTREEVGLKGYPTWTDIGLAPVGYIVSTLLAAGATAIFSLIPWFDAEQAQDVGFSTYIMGGERVVAFLILVVVAPIVEEVLFRGWLYGKLRARMNMPVAILITSVLFGLMHFQWNVGVNVFCLSAVLCGLREVTGTIYAGMLTHMVKNGVAFYLLYVLGV